MRRSSPERLHLVDGTYELFRAHYSKAPDRPMKATKGMVQSILALVRDKAERVTHMAVAFDNPIRSFRNKLYAGYKTEKGVDRKLLAQFDAAEKAVRGAERLAATFARARAEALLYRTLTRLRFDVPLRESLDDLRIQKEAR